MGGDVGEDTNWAKNILIVRLGKQGIIEKSTSEARSV